MLKPVLVFDVDGVLLRWNSRLIEFLSHHIQVPEWIISAVKEDEYIDFKEIEKLLPNFLNLYHQSSYAQNFDLFHKKSYDLISQCHQNYRLIVLTNFSSDPQAISNRKANLSKVFGDVFEDIICLEPTDLKVHALATIPDFHLFIDDSQSQISEAHKTFPNKCIHFNIKDPELWQTLSSRLQIQI